MGRFGVNDADNYGGNGGSNFFALKNDGDVARVRFMYNGAEDVSGYAVHEIEVDGKKRYVNCLREYNEPKDTCPLCAANNFQKAKLFIPLYDVDNDTVYLWERGKKYFAKIAALCSRYSSADRPLVNWQFDIERHGKAGDQQTTYEIYSAENDETRLDDLPEIPEVLGSIILDKSFDELATFVSTGRFSENSGNEISRRSRNSDEPTRRTPSARRSDSDRF